MYTRTETLSSAQSLTASTAGGSAYNSTAIDLGGALGAHFVFNLTSNASTANINPTISHYSTAGGIYYSLLTSTISATGATVLKLGIGLESTTNQQNDYLPQKVRLSVTHSTTSAVTYSIGMHKFYSDHSY